MKFSLTLGQRRPLDRQTARGCLVANLFGLPGIGSLAAGRRSGYAQMMLSLTGLALTTIFAIRFFLWYSSSSNGSQQPQDDLGQLWLHVRWAFLGMAVFACGWLWGFFSGLAILLEARPNEPPPAPTVPPKL